MRTLKFPSHLQTDPARAISWETLALTRFLLAWVVLSVHTFMPSRIASAFVIFGGKAAVIGFMLISGFSIAASIKSRPQGFILRRILRIYPMYFGAVLFTLLVQALMAPRVEVAGMTIEASGWGRILGNLLLTQMYLCKTLDFNGPFWSLSIEFSYYMVAPLFLLLPRAWLLFLIVLSGVVFVLPVNPDNGRLYDLLTHFNGLRYLWSWLMGFCIFSNTSRPLAVIGLLFSLAVFPFGARDLDGYVPFLTILGTYVLLHCAHLISVGGYAGKAFDFLGDMSYPLYLVHFPLSVLLVAGLHVQSDILFFALALALTYLNILLFDGYLKRVFFRPVFTRLYSLVANPGK